ncbi:MAG: hypothetical protein JSR85_07645 [Proteobacteria bacterium]|nr:hypothetical protein [Pseudomonadota bacterium]
MVEISKTYQVRRATLYRWIKNRKKEGSIYPKTYWQKGYDHKIQDFKAFKKFIEKNPKRTLAEMAEACYLLKKEKFRYSLI